MTGSGNGKPNGSGALQGSALARLATSQLRSGIGRALEAAPEPVQKALGPAAQRLSLQTMPAVPFEGEALRWHLQGSILEVEMHREPCNEIGTAALAELEKLAALVRSGSGGARAMVLYSSVAKGFSAGADLRELYQGITENRGHKVPKPVTQMAVRHFLDRIHAIYDTLDSAPITTVGAIHGFCFGGGFELALTTDVLIADKSARFCFPELRLGLVPGFGGIPRLRRDLGNGVVRDLLLTGRSINARRAHEVGLVSQLVGRGQAAEVARRTAAQATKFDGATTAAAKAFTKPIPHAELAREKRLFLQLFSSPTTEQALHDFVHSTSPHSYLP
jgi:enoyl-CoA hydratase/carnithine racemase